MQDRTMTDESAGPDIAGLDIDGPCKLLLAFHFQSYEDMRKCISIAVVIENYENSFNCQLSYNAHNRESYIISITGCIGNGVTL